jgi:uncharacterized protein
MTRITHQEAKILKNILKKYKNVYVFGSRTKGTNQKFSDLDICLKDTISAYDLEMLKEKLEESDLPFIVDVMEYQSASDFFKKIIDKEAISLEQFLALSSE